MGNIMGSAHHMRRWLKPRVLAAGLLLVLPALAQTGAPDGEAPTAAPPAPPADAPPKSPKAPPAESPTPKPAPVEPAEQDTPSPSTLENEPEPGAQVANDSEPEPAPAPKKPVPATKPPPAPKPNAAPPRSAPPESPKAQAAPKAPPPESASAALKVELSPQLEKRRVDLEAAITAAYKKKSTQPKVLEAVCRQWQPKRLYDADPTLAPRLKLCAAEAAIADGRLSAGEARFSEALALAKVGTDADLLNRIEMVRGDTYAARLEAYERCGTRLGLSGLKAFEADEETRLFEMAITSYRHVATGDDQMRAAHAMASIAGVAAEVYRRSLRAHGGYRGIDLPGRAAIAPAEGTPLPQDLTHRGHWAREIDRLFALALFRANELKLPALATQIKSERQKFRGFTPEPFETIRTTASPDGAMRFYRGQFEQKSGATWSAMAPAAALRQLNQDSAANFNTATGPFSLRALAAGGKEVPAEAVTEALSNPKDPRFLAALEAVHAAPSPAFFAPLMTAWSKVRATAKWHNDDYTRRYSTLDRALYGPEEQVLSALRAVVTKERPLALKASYDARLPLSERAYLLAELADNRSQYRLQELLRGADEVTAAVALYGIHKALGQRSVWTIKVYSRGVTGCVARHLLDLEATRK